MSYLLAYNPYNTNLFMKNRSIDPAAQAYFNATGITGDAQQQAINNLVKGLKQSGLWSKMKAVYPFVTDNRNLISYSEDFSNAYWAKNNSTITVNSTIAPNGTLTADTLTDNATNNFHGISTFQTAFGQNGNNTLSIYAKANSLNYLILYFYNGSEPSGKSAWFNLSNGTIGTVQSGITASIENAGNGWYRCSITRNFNFTATFSNCGYGVANNDNVVTYIGSNQSIYIWGAQVDAAATATTYQPIATTQQAFISSQFKYNLVNPVDSDAAFRLVFNGGWSFSSTGATPNGVNGYADTKLNPTIALTNYNAHSSTYNRTNSDNVGWEIGLTQSVGVYANEFLLAGRKTDFSVSGLYDFGNPNGEVKVASSSAVGFFQNSITSNTSQKLYKNGVQIGVNTNTNNSTPANGNIYLSAVNDINTTAIAFSIVQQAFVSIGDGLTDDDATNLYYYTQVFQTTLGRQVGSPAYALPAVSDINAKLYLSAIGSTTNSTLNNAVDTFIKGLKADGIYSKMKAVYPFVTDNRNLLSYTEDFSNAYWTKAQVTFSPNAITAPNGTLTAGLITVGSVNGEHNIYNLSGVNTIANQTYTHSIYVKKGTARYVCAWIYYTTAGGGPFATFDLDSQTLVASGNGLGTYVGSNIENAGNGWYRISVSGYGNYTSIIVSVPDIRISGSLIPGGANSYMGTGQTLYSWGAQLELGSTATAYQPILGSQQSYISNQFKYNMVNPQDDDSAFRLVFNGGWTHSANGALPNGTNGYADTFLIPSSVLAQNNASLGYYGGQTGTGINKCAIGSARTTVISCFNLYPAFTGFGLFGDINDGSNTYTANTNSAGFILASRLSSTQKKHFIRNVANTLTENSATLNSFKVFVGARNTNGTATDYFDKQIRYSFIADGLTDTEAANLYSRVQALQTALNRQV